MALGIETGLVKQVMDLNKGFNLEERRQQIYDKCDAYEYVGLPIDRRRVNAAIWKYKLLEKYNSQNNGKRAIRKKMTVIFENLKREIQRGIEDRHSSLIECKFKKVFTDDCSCGGAKIEYKITAKYLSEIEEGFVVPRGSESSLYFCWHCGSSSQIH